MFATIIHGHDGVPHRYYATREAALAAAKRLHRRCREAIEVVWCRERGNPKLWLAMVDADGVTYDDLWHVPR